MAPGKGHRKSSKKENNPFKVPEDALLLSYWHYLRASEKRPKVKKKSRKELCGYLAAEKAKAAKESESEIIDNLMKKISTRSAGTSFSRLRYVQDIRLLCKMRLLSGKKRDGCILLDQKLALERMKYRSCKKQYNECVRILELFLAEDHEKSMRAMDMASAEIKFTEQLTVRRDELSHLCGKARIEVYQWEETWRTVKACLRFLHLISPRTNENPTVDERPDDTYSLKSKSIDSNYGKTTSLDSLIEMFEKDEQELSKSHFKNPMELGLMSAEDILETFREIELQNLNALIHLESLGNPVTDMIAKVSVAEKDVKLEINYILNDIVYLQMEIEREEQRAKHMEKYSDQLINEALRELITSQPALQVRIIVEDAYESCVPQNPVKLEPLMMTQALEDIYEQLSSELDSLPRHIVLECEHEGFKKELRETLEAEEAADKFELMHRLLATVKRLMEPTAPKSRPLMKRSVPATSKVVIDETTALVNVKPDINFFEYN
ncbi:PREDICTED: uncharacterized protein LOC105360753 [Ceratosolen solmsi marchali]|uniref:Uncharacterized protein LOC105360753 n=1 Tax=Ceratosolen solmsi marchali TaxID=326594 RepID=A0AAJ6YDH3_9HYME|nr:PREDICTED: uncharacterized protein LOC105360753 [Ceratosolen solmsi marchali]